jgi:hypothetical protein
LTLNRLRRRSTGLGLGNRVRMAWDAEAVGFEMRWVEMR